MVWLLGRIHKKILAHESSKLNMIDMSVCVYN